MKLDPTKVTIRIGDRVIPLEAFDLKGARISTPRAPLPSVFVSEIELRRIDLRESEKDASAIVAEGEDVTDRPALPAHTEGSEPR